MNGYCEWVGDGLLAEPANAVTNLAFLLAAAALVWQLRRNHRPAPLSVWILPILLAVVGLCSLSFHTTGAGWAAALDSLSIVVFVLIAVVVYLFWMWGIGWRWAWLGAPAFLVFMVAVDGLLYIVGGATATLGGYLPALMGLLGYGTLVLRTALARARRYGLWLLGAAGVFTVSLTLRTLDQPLCDAFPVGTHWAWHCLNAVVLYLVGSPIIRRWIDERSRGATRTTAATPTTHPTPTTDPAQTRDPTPTTHPTHQDPGDHDLTVPFHR